jgi:predicted DNA binding CopG/RHH family protein
MPKLAFNVPHQLSQDEATQRLKQRVADARQSYQQQVSGFEETWSDSRLDFRFSTMGITVKGHVTSAPAEVRVHADLPLIALPFKGTIEKQVREELTRLLV